MSESEAGIVGGWRVPVALRLPEAPLTSLVWECAAVAFLAPILLVIAAWNGFPITFYDTGAYILQGLANYFVPERAPVYSYFLWLAGAQESLWWVAGSQAAIIAFVMVEFARTEAPRATLWGMLGIGAFLCLFTGVGWVSAEIEPDCFTAVVVLSLWLLAFRPRALGYIRCVLLIAAGSLAIAAHPSHLGLAAGLVLAIVLFAFASVLLRGRVVLLQADAALPIMTFALAVGLVMIANYVLTTHVFVSRAGPVFMTARMIEDGVAKRVLDETCPGSGFVLCRYKERLPATADDYLWEPDSPFNKLGRFRGSAKESQAIMTEGFTRYPLMEMGAMLKNGARQFFMFRTGDGVAPQERVLNTEFRNFLPAQMKAYSIARQQREAFSFVLLNIVHVGLAALALFALCVMIRDAARTRDWQAFMLPAFVLLALSGNALVCGATSGPHDRYQSRLIWIAVFVVILTVRPSQLALRRRAESGT